MPSSPRPPRYISTRGGGLPVPFREALLAGLAPDGGLFVPTHVPPLAGTGWETADSLAEVGRRVLAPWLEAEFGRQRLDDIVDDALSFPVPLVPLAGGEWDGVYVLELFHGPTLSFKDVGARTMARLMAEGLEGEPITILAATSGDTGSAVADGFAGRPGVRVVLLYPKGQVSPVQERQLIVERPGVQALAVEGTFDDCQRLVKAAFSEPGLGRLSSANSINIGRLLPQMLYYTWAVRQLASGEAGEGGRGIGEGDLPAASGVVGSDEPPLPDGRGRGRETDASKTASAGSLSPQASGADGTSPLSSSPFPLPTLVVPSGNLGNLTAGMLAQAAGLPVGRFVAAHNANAGFARFLDGAAPEAVASVRTLSNAMDVGAPSNLERLRWLHDDDALRTRASGAEVSDADTLRTMREVYETTGYLADPHTAVGLEAARRTREGSEPIIVLSTAHPAKFPEAVSDALGLTPEAPERLARLWDAPTRVTTIAPTMAALRPFLPEA